MANLNTIQIKRGSGAPSTAALRLDGELGYDKTNHTLYINNNGVIEIPLANLYEANLKWGGKNFSASYGPLDAAMVPELGANRFAFLKAAGLTIQYSTDNGSTWTDYGATDAQKVGLFSSGQNFYLGKHSGSGTSTINDQLRVEIATSAAGIYTVLNKIVIYMSTQGNTVEVKIEKALKATPTEFNTHLNWTGISGWGGWNVLNINNLTTYGNAAASQYGRIRFTFRQTAIRATNSAALIHRILGFGGMGWTTPSNMAKNGHLYSYDSSQNATFPAKVTATSFAGSGASLTSINASNISSGTLAVARGGTGATSFTANSLIISGSSTTAALTTRAITNNTSDTAIVNNTNIPTMNTIYYGLATVNNASQTRATAIYAPTSAGTANQILVSSGDTAAPTWKATASGAAYATSTNGALTFGTLPVAQGGTGLTSLDSFVRTTGTQTVGGTKTFTSYPRIRNTVAATTGAQFPAIFFQGALSTDDLARIGVVTDTNDAPVYIGFRIMSYNSSTYLPLEKYENYYLPQVTADLGDNVSYQVHTTKTLKIQHGFATISTTAPSSNNITYSGFTTIPKVFATYNINATSISGDNTGDKGAIKIYNISTSGCKVVIGGSASGTMRIAWVAIGT